MSNQNKSAGAPKLRETYIQLFDKKGRGWGKTTSGGSLIVPHTIPGETIIAEKGKRGHGAVHEVIDPSPHRIEPRCQHVGQCGGCRWQHIAYEHQLRLKQQEAERLFLREGLERTADQLPIQGSPPFQYRNRMDFIWWFDGRFGLREEGKWHAIVDLHECHLIDPAVMKIALEVNRRAQSMDLPLRDAKYRRPGLRYLVIRHGVFTGEVMLIFVSDDVDLPPALWQGFERVVSVWQLINDNFENDASDGAPRHLSGADGYREQIQGHTFEVGPRSFFQPNPTVTHQMVDHVRSLVPQPRPLLIDLYCGVGLFSNLLADRFGQVIGIESEAEAIQRAQRNTQAGHVEYHCLDAEAAIRFDFPQDAVLLLDPPRAGIHPKVEKWLLEKRFAEIIYVSCNPRKSIPNLAILEKEYNIISTALFDQFPQTAHVELISHLRLRDGT